MNEQALTYWLDAADRGGYPGPARGDRWQVLRAGVVSLWEFEQAEFWYADGWAQLSGSNETGKSTLMALTTLIPWLADTSASNIDTFARSGKHFRFYVEPTGQDGDRRSAEASANRGWLWVEYGRLVDGEPRFFTVLLFAEARAAASSVELKWCTLEGDQRVRASLDLAPRRIVASWKEIETPGFQAHATAAAYKAHVAARLLASTVDRLEAVGKMLKVTRTPKLGAQLQIAFVQDRLRDALPELNRGEIDALATGWDQLDQIRADLASTREAAATIARLRKRAWLPWVEAALRERADAAAAARTEFDRVTRLENEARATLGRHEAEAAQLADETARHKVAADSARAAAEALQGSVRYRDAESRLQALTNHRSRRDALESQLAEREAAVGKAAQRLARAQEEEADHANRLEVALAGRDAALEDFSAIAVQVRLGPLAAGSDTDAADQSLRDLTAAVDRAEELVEQAGAADQAATLAETRAAGATDRAQTDRANAEEGWAAAETARAGLVQALPHWADSVRPGVASPLVNSWIDALPTTTNEDGGVPGTPLGAQIRLDWYDPARRELDHARAEAARLKSEAEAEVANRASEIERLRSAPTPSYAAPRGWVRRDRPAASPQGAPLWSLVNPGPGLDGDALAGIEAGLAGIGLLDAWVTPDGLYLPHRDGDDVVAALTAAVGSPSLADHLQVADEAGGLGDTVRSVLAGVGYEQQFSPDQPNPSPVAVGPDGHWRTPNLAGRARPLHGHAEWIGEAARAAGRRRQILALAEEKAAWQDTADHQGEALARLDASLDGLDKAFARSPDDTALRTGLGVAHERETVAQRSQAAAERAGAEAGRMREAADSARAVLLEFCAAHGLPDSGPGLRQVRARLAEASKRLTAYRHAAAAAVDAGRAFDQAGARAAEAEDDHLTQTRLRDATAGQLADARATVDALESTMGADDTAVLAELDNLKQAEREAATRRDDCLERLRTVSAQVGSAKAALAASEENRQAATHHRERVFARFRQLVDQGLADEAGLALPQPMSGTVDAVRDQVAETRRRVTPKQWPETPEDRETLVKRLESDLRTAALEARTPLEAGSRTLRLHTDGLGLPRIEIIVDSSGAGFGPREAEVRLEQIHEELASAYNQRVQETLDELLGSTFLEHLRDRLGDAFSLVGRINSVLADHRLATTQTSLGIRLEPVTDADKAMIDAIRGSALANPEVATHVRNNLRARVEEAKQAALAAGQADWRDRLADQLDYRAWLDVQLRRKIGSDGRWAPLTTTTFAEMSGGARAVMLMLPLVSTLAALYEDMPGAPRPLWLDEAFDGLDNANRAMVMGLFREFDLDVLMAGPSRLVNVATVPAAAIYQVVRAPAPLPGVDLMAELWAGGDLIQVNLPVTLPTGLVSPDTDTLLTDEPTLI